MSVVRGALTFQIFPILFGSSTYYFISNLSIFLVRFFFPQQLCCATEKPPPELVDTRSTVVKMN